LEVLPRCSFALDGQEAIDKIKNQVRGRLKDGHLSNTIRPVSLLLLDLQMPKKNGIEVFKEVKEFFKQLNNMAEEDV
jgi:CheY-like chemotaxis protein